MIDDDTKFNASSARPVDGAGASGDRQCASGGPTVSELLRDRTRDVHVQAERSGVIRLILRGEVSRHAYAVFLRNLLPAYCQLESGLERGRSTSWLGAIALPALYRKAALVSDLDSLMGAEWRRELPLFPESERYAERIAAAGEGAGYLLIAHAYTRYMGDLSGGQILRRILARSLELGPEALSFYDFPEIDDLESFKAAYRDAIDNADVPPAMRDVIVHEACEAFRHNIAISEAVQSMADRPG